MQITRLIQGLAQGKKQRLFVLNTQDHKPALQSLVDALAPLAVQELNKQMEIDLENQNQTQNSDTEGQVQQVQSKQNRQDMAVGPLHTLLWSLAILDIKNQSLLDAIMQRQMINMSQQSARDISISVWSLGKFRLRRDWILNSYLEASSKAFLKILKEQNKGNKLDISNFVAGLQESQYNSPRIANALSNIIINRAQAQPDFFDIDSVCQIAYSFARFDHKVNPILYEVLFANAIRDNRQLTQQQIGILALACAKARIYNLPFFNYLKEQILGLEIQKQSAKPVPIQVHSIAFTIGALSTTGYLDPQVFAFLKQVFTENIGEFIKVPSRFSYSLWGLAISDQIGPDTLQLLRKNFVNLEHMQYGTERKTDVEVLVQLSQSQLLVNMKLRSMGVQDLGSYQFLEPRLFQEAANAWRKSVKEKTSMSLLHTQVVDILRSLQVKHQVEYIPPSGFVSVDIFIQFPVLNLNLALEVDGPYHFSVNKPHVNLGTAIARNRLLRYYGYQVVQIPYFEWDAIVTDDARREYLNSKILAEVEAFQARKVQEGLA